MNYSALKIKLETAEMLELADDDVRKAALESDVVIKISLSSHDIKKYLMMSGVWLPIKKSTSDNAEIAIDSLTEFTDFDVSDSAVLAVLVSVLDGLVVDVTEFTEVHKSTILSFGDSTTSWAKQNGYNPLRIGYFDKARAL